MAIDLRSQKTIYEDLLPHLGHELEIVHYGPDQNRPDNIAIECLTCGEVLLDADNPD